MGLFDRFRGEPRARVRGSTTADGGTPSTFNPATHGGDFF